MRHADLAVVVANPEVSSVRDSDRIIGLLDSTTDKAKRGELMDKYLLLTRYDPARAERGEMLCVDDVLRFSASLCSESFLRAKMSCMPQTWVCRLR